jgi:hypothetical protein
MKENDEINGNKEISSGSSKKRDLFSDNPVKAL